MPLKWTFAAKLRSTFDSRHLHFASTCFPAGRGIFFGAFNALRVEGTKREGMQ